MIHSTYCPTCHNHINTCKQLKLVACKEAKAISRKKQLEAERLKIGKSSSISARTLNYLEHIK